MAQEWRATGGRSGLPVVDFGHVLRVPRQALEKMVGTEFTAAPPGESVQAIEAGAGRESGQRPARPRPRPTRRTSAKNSRRNRATTNGQLDLFDASD